MTERERREFFATIYATDPSCRQFEAEARAAELRARRLGGLASALMTRVR